MIREVSSKDIQYSDKELNKILKKYDDEVMNYVKNTLLYELASFQLASAYNHDCIWPDSSLENEYIEAMGFLSFVKPAFKKIDKNKINRILEEKYSLKVINDDPIKIEEIKKEPSN